MRYISPFQVANSSPSWGRRAAANPRCFHWSPGSIIRQPAILLADEPTGNLDSKNGARVFDLLVKLNRDRSTTLLLVTHDHALAGQADRVISLNEGRIVEDRETERRGDGETGRGGDRETG